MAAVPLGIAPFLMKKPFLLALPALSLPLDGRATSFIEGARKGYDA